MRVMKFISVAVALAMFLTFAIAQQAARHSECSDSEARSDHEDLADFRQGHVQQLLRRVPWKRRQR